MQDAVSYSWCVHHWGDSLVLWLDALVAHPVLWYSQSPVPPEMRTALGLVAFVPEMDDCLSIQ